MKTAVVVGGGIAGILSAILLKRHFDRITLIEKQERIGGLLNSVQNEQGLWFDYGSHFLRETGDEALDELLFGDITPEEWRILENLKGGGYYASRFNEVSPFLDARGLPADIYRKGMMQLLELCDHPSSYRNLDEQLRGTFGDIFTEYLFKPILEGKFYGCDLRDLSVDSHHLFGLSRIIGFNPATARELKKSDVLDQKLAFHSFKEGNSSLRNFYPLHGGAGKWIDLLTHKLSQLGVQILLNTSVTRICHSGKRVSSVDLSSGDRLPCDHLVWTIPVFHCIRASELNFESETTSPPSRLITSLYLFSFDQPFLTPVQYVQCHEPMCSTFRITIYPNIQLRQTAVYHLTVEVISRSNPDLEQIAKTVYQELIAMKIVSPEAKILYQKNVLIQEGFPFPTHHFTNRCKQQLDFVSQHLKNATFLGKGTAGQFLTHDVSVHVYKTINTLNACLEKGKASMVTELG